jgi:hypothetical protein
MELLRIIGPVVALGGFTVWVASLTHCAFRRDLPRPHTRALRFALVALLVCGVALPQPFSFTRSIINGAETNIPLRREMFIPKPFSDTHLLEARSHSLWQFYHADRVLINRKDGSRLVDMESQTVVLPLWFVLSLVIYWSMPLWRGHLLRAVRRQGVLRRSGAYRATT